MFLVRHGEATGEEGDPGLSPLGRSQAGRLGDRLRSEGVVEVRHSPRRRAAETAAVIGERCGVPVVADPRLDDRTPMPAAGQPYPDQLRAFFDAVPTDERDEGGVRLTSAASAFLADERPVVLVTHAFVVAWFVREALGAPVPAWTSIAVANAGLTTIVPRPGRSPGLLGVNDVGHLLGQ